MLLLTFGFITLIAIPIAAVTYSQVKKPLVYDAPVEIDIGEASVLGFEANLTGVDSKLYIYVKVYPVRVGPTEVYPLLAIAMVDEEGLRRLENNQTPGYLYLRAVGVDNSTVFELENVKPGTYYLVFSNAIPEKAELKITVVSEYWEWNIDYRLLRILASVGVTLIALGFIWDRIRRRIRRGT